MPPLSPPNLLLSAACDEVVAATKAYHIALDRGAPEADLVPIAKRHSDAVHYINVLTRKLAEGAAHAEA